VHSVHRVPIKSAETVAAEAPRARVNAVELGARRALKPLDAGDHHLITSSEVFEI
jgi:hypothetical protein